MSEGFKQTYAGVYMESFLTVNQDAARNERLIISVELYLDAHSHIELLLTRLEHRLSLCGVEKVNNDPFSEYDLELYCIYRF